MTLTPLDFLFIFAIAAGIVLAVLILAALPYLLPAFLGLLGLATTAGIAFAVYLALPAPIGAIAALGVAVVALWLAHRLSSPPQRTWAVTQADCDRAYREQAAQRQAQRERDDKALCEARDEAWHQKMIIPFLRK